MEFGFDESKKNYAKDSPGSFLVTMLGVWDQKMHLPIGTVTYMRDFPIRRDASIENSNTTFTFETYGSSIASGDPADDGIAWSSVNGTANASVDINSEVVTNPLRIVKYDLAYDYVELKRSLTNRVPLDQRKYKGTIALFQKNCDRATYLGSPKFRDFYGMLNNPNVPAYAAALKDAGGISWDNATPLEKLADLNAIVNQAIENAQLGVFPNWMTMSWSKWTDIVNTPLTINGSTYESIYVYFMKNNSIVANGGTLTIKPTLWNEGAGEGGTDMIHVYYKDYEYVRMPLVKLQRTPIVQMSTEFKSTYFGAIGQPEITNTMTMAYLYGV